MNGFPDADKKNALLEELTNPEQELARRNRKNMDMPPKSPPGQWCSGCTNSLLFSDFK